MKLFELVAPEETLKIRMENDETGKEELVEKTAVEWAGFVACTVYRSSEPKASTS